MVISGIKKPAKLYAVLLRVIIDKQICDFV